MCVCLCLTNDPAVSMPAESRALAGNSFCIVNFFPASAFMLLGGRIVGEYFRSDSIYVIGVRSYLDRSAGNRTSLLSRLRTPPYSYPKGCRKTPKRVDPIAHSRVCYCTTVVACQLHSPLLWSTTLSDGFNYDSVARINCKISSLKTDPLRPL